LYSNLSSLLFIYLFIFLIIFLDDGAPWNNDEGQLADQNLFDMYNMHRSAILATHKHETVQNRYNFPLNNDVDINLLVEHLRTIYQAESETFRFNLSFGFILQHVETNEYRFFHPYSNTYALDSPLSISTPDDILKVETSLDNMKILDLILKERPNTKWRFAMVTNVIYITSHTTFPLGCDTFDCRAI